MGRIATGLKDYWRAQRVLFREGLWPLFLIPGLVSVLFVPLSALVTFFFLKGATDYVHENWIPDALKSDATFVLLSIVLWVVGIFVGFLAFRNFIMILYSPILGYLSEAVERKEFGAPSEDAATPRFRWRDAAYSAYRGTAMSLLTLLFALIGLATSFLVALIPVVGGILAAIFLPVLQAFLAGIGFCDPLLERRRYSIGASLGFAWRNRGRLFGHGLGFTLLMLVPVVGWFLAPSYGVVAGTLGTAEILGGQRKPE